MRKNIGLAGRYIGLEDHQVLKHRSGKQKESTYHQDTCPCSWMMRGRGSLSKKGVGVLECQARASGILSEIYAPT
jgi:hypothetical protein